MEKFHAWKLLAVTVFEFGLQQCSSLLESSVIKSRCKNCRFITPEACACLVPLLSSQLKVIPCGQNMSIFLLICLCLTTQIWSAPFIVKVSLLFLYTKNLLLLFFFSRVEQVKKYTNQLYKSQWQCLCTN